MRPARIRFYCLRAKMLRAVQFHDQLFLWAVEIDNVTTDTVLPSKIVAESFCSHMRPQYRFLRSEASSEFTAAKLGICRVPQLRKHEVIVALKVTQTRPSPPALSLAGRGGRPHTKIT